VSEIDDAEGAFARGDYRTARDLAKRLTHDATTEEERDRARAVMQRLAPDPYAIILFIVAAAFVCALSAYWMIHGRDAHDPTRPTKIQKDVE
jgi:hypothetical protein